VGAGHWEGKVSLTAVQCRQYADECLAIAERAEREGAASLLKMAETWLQLAEQLLTQERPVIGSDQNAPSTDKL
jgi:uncharacterized protein YhjY with autotransporter beta-barrel domain